MSVSSDGVTEWIAPDDGHRESRWVFLTVVLILLAGGAGLLVNQSEPVKVPAHLQLNVNEKAILTALRNAGDEILFLAENEASLPDVSSLSQAGVPPFAVMPGQQSRYLWQRLPGGCYIGTPKAGARITFLLLLENDVAVFWRSSPETEPHHDRHDESTRCQPDSSWQEFRNA